ncbi:TonB-dependent receptor [Methylomicrobium sp. Wu6]|uniref:TonB-dependent receptor n=1 Tax=Methylomicrobium sp. Wu6 TaxID=3107928 RepID=UPI002DD6340D|nr:TonB-dependent receptor [Methylomicrobium sp. Wu6]MEC4748428.1 TonB-dependent receptor [Methylomicrobium sp. Wu6]
MLSISNFVVFLPYGYRLRPLCLLILIPWSSPVFSKEVDESGFNELDTITVEEDKSTTIGPWEGLQLSREELPANVQSLSSKDIKESLATSLGDLMNSKLQSVNINDYAGNPFQMDITFRGFSASPQLGTPQGLSVFLDGVRVNEPFGDIVNWDLIPMNALSGIDIFPGSNPLFGLNTLGGALALRTKNGFEDAGVDVSFQGGSWNRKKGELTAGWNKGKLGAFLAFTGFDEEGWRVNSPSQVNQGFARFDWRDDNFSLRFSTLAVGNTLLGNGLIPKDMYNLHPESVFTSPDSTENELQQYNLGGELFFNDNLSLTGQIYRRDSNRTSLAGDIYEDFDEMDEGRGVNKLEAIPEQPTSNGKPIPVCQYQDVNSDNVPDYYVVKDLNGDGFLDDDEYEIIDRSTINAPLTHKLAEDNVELLPPLNGNCGRLRYNNPGGPGSPVRPRNGKKWPAGSVASKGWAEGTPIGVLSNTAVKQKTDGASLQLNWNSDQHKFMAGGSIDAADTDFETSQRLGLIDADHRVYSDPAQIDPIYVAAREDIRNNSFTGKSTTFSSYFSETYSPRENLHLSVSGRFNQTRVKNRVRARTRVGFEALHQILDIHKFRPNVTLCKGTDPASCPPEANYNIGEFDQDVRQPLDPTLGLGKYSETPTSETFDYTSFNPSLGISYLPFKDKNVLYKDLNLFFNWSQGTRAPSTVELGCAYDGTLVPEDPSDPDSPLTPKSFATVGGACTLPTALSGDPYLPQIFANSFEFGVRGSLFKDWGWNATVYRTDLRDDIYLVGLTPDRSFFDTIGDTRRQGIEFGFSGKVGIVDFSLNYGYTDATFQSNLVMVSPHNSSAAVISPDDIDYLASVPYDAEGRPMKALDDMIEIKSGDRMPGIPQHNMNATLNFHLAPKWEFGINMIAHSSSFVRGNENNEHQQGDFDRYYGFDPGSSRDRLLLKGQPFKDPGSVAGYVIFNLKTRYQLTKGLSVFGMVNNLFDRQYATAGRLGINPFSPSERGAIGPSGWNYNSRDWQNSTFIGPGAPRAFWVGFDYKFAL